MTQHTRRSTILLIALLLAALPGATLAADWWVRADGSDSCDGKANSPAGSGGSCAFRTIAKAIGRAGCGDTVHVGPGDYFEDRIRITKSCTAASPLVIEGAGIDSSYWLAGAIDVDDSTCEPDGTHAGVYRCRQPAGTATTNSPSACVLQRHTTAVYWEDENHTSGDMVGPVCLTRNTNGAADVAGKEGTYYEDGTYYWIHPWDDRDPRQANGTDFIAARSVCSSSSTKLIHIEADHVTLRKFTIVTPCYSALGVLPGSEGTVLEDIHVYGGLVWIYNGSSETTIRHFKVLNTLRRPNNMGTVTGQSWDAFSQCMVNQGQHFTYEDIETYGCREGFSLAGGAAYGTIDGLFVHGSFNHGLKIQDPTTHDITIRDALTYNNQEAVFIECPYNISFENSTFPFNSVLIQGNPHGGCGDKPKNLDFHNCIINRMLWFQYDGDTWAKGGHDLDYNVYIEDNGRNYVQRNIAHDRSMSLPSWQNWADDPCPDCTRDPHSRTAKRAEVYIHYMENDDRLDAGYDFDLKEDSPVVGISSSSWGDGVDIEGVTRSTPRDPGAYDHTEGSGGGGSPTPACSDGVDNDGDGAVDYPDDFGCSSADDDSEVGNTACSDGVDNDGDGKVDQADGNCTSRTDDSESRCGDGVREPGAEECDGSDLGDATCESLGHDAGTLACDSTCHYDESACNDRPGTPENLHRTDTH